MLGWGDPRIPHESVATGRALGDRAGHHSPDHTGASRESGKAGQCRTISAGGKGWGFVRNDRAGQQDDIGGGSAWRTTLPPNTRKPLLCQLCGLPVTTGPHRFDDGTLVHDDCLALQRLDQAAQESRAAEKTERKPLPDKPRRQEEPWLTRASFATKNRDGTAKTCEFCGAAVWWHWSHKRWYDPGGEVLHVQTCAQRQKHFRATGSP